MRFGRRSADEILPDAAESDTPVRAQGTYRVAVAHKTDGHPESTPAHWGPAYNESFREVLMHATGGDVDSVDLLEEARKGAQRAQQEHGDDYAVWVERLVLRGTHGEWERM